MDLVGPISVVSHHGGFKYFQSYIDVTTRLSVVSLLKKKSDAFVKSISCGFLSHEYYFTPVPIH